jgi:hypothetical protein
MMDRQFDAGGGRTLIARADAIWLWPGVPLAMVSEHEIKPLPEVWVSFWVASLNNSPGLADIA